MKGILGRKLGMTQIFSDAGAAVPVTVIEAGPCPVLQVKTADADGYAAVQLGFGAQTAKKVSRAELGRYLDYCSELLSLTSKIAALFVERFDDPVTLGAVTEIETLTAGLSRKVWQKISMLNPAV